MDSRQPTNDLARDKLVQKLNQSSREAPRFLYRGWSNRSCGGIAGLNTAERITPLAFLQDPSQPVQHLGEHPQARELVVNHENNSARLRTEFSSWTDSYMLAWRMAAEGSFKSAHISIIDRERLGRPVNFYHLVDLYELGLAELACYEWLAHGVVEGEGLQTKALSKMTGTKKDGHMQWLKLEMSLPRALVTEAHLQIPGLKRSITRTDVERAIIETQRMYFSGPTSGRYRVLMYTAIVEQISIAAGNSWPSMRCSNHIYSFMRGLLMRIAEDEYGVMGKAFAERMRLNSVTVRLTNPKVISHRLAKILEEPSNSWMIGEDRYGFECTVL